ncbi:MAG: hypothetical protein JXM74_01510 [Fusobacteriaceae bacterium]|nr:hypothetical protein [Fusobacteriaceae bacterium]
MFFENSLNGFIYLLKLNAKNKKIILYTIIGIFISVVLLAGLINQLFGSIENFNYFMDLESDNDILSSKFESLSVIIIIFAYALITSTFHYCFSVFQINETIKMIDAQEDITYRKLSVWKSVWLDIKIGLSMLGVMFIPSFFIGLTVRNELFTVLIITLLFLTLIPLLVIRLSLYKITYTIGMEDHCLRSSFSLTKNNFWKMFGIFIVVSTLQSVVSGFLMSFSLIFSGYIMLILLLIGISFLYFLNISMVTLLPISIYYSLINGKPLSEPKLVNINNGIEEIN